MKYILLLLIGIAMHGCAVAQGKKNNERVLEERQRLKNYAMCSCLRNVLPKGDSLLALDGSPTGYFELGRHSIDVYSMVDSVAKIYSSKVYPSKDNRPLGLMKCLDFYSSETLEEFILKMDKELSEEVLCNGCRYR